MALLAIALRHVRSMQTMVRAIGSQLPMLDGNRIPMLGLGVYLAPVDGETEKAMSLGTETRLPAHRYGGVLQVSQPAVVL